MKQEREHGEARPTDGKTLLLLGAGGFIGSHLVEHLLQLGRHRLIGLDLTDEKLVGIEGKNFTFHKADLRDYKRVEPLIAEADIVVDLIAYANPSLYVSAPLEVFDLNFVQNLEVAKLCARHRKRLIQYSSAEVYGKNAEGGSYSEEHSDFVYGPVNKQRWIYASGKALLERVLYAQAEAGELEYTIIRPFNFIGSRFDYLVPAHALGGPRVFAHFISALLTGGPLRLVDGGTVHRAFMHIHDANRAFETLLDHPGARNQIFNVGNPENNLTIAAVAQLMLELYEELTGQWPSSEVVSISGVEFYGEGYEDGDRLPPNVSKMMSLGWAPREDLRSTFREAMSHYLVPAEHRSAAGPARAAVGRE